MKILRTALRRMMPGEIGSSTFACFRPSTWKGRSKLTARPGSIAGWSGAVVPIWSRPASGREVQQAMDRRREHLIGQGDAVSHGDGRILYRRNLLATLEQRDVVSTSAALAASRSLPFRATGDGETVQGVLRSPIIPCTIFERLVGCRWCGDNATYRDQKCQGCAGSQDADEGHNRQRVKKMIQSKLDSDTSFAQLTDGRLDRYGIATVTGRNGWLTATLIFDGTKILVRADQQNNVARLVPTADNPEIGYILNAISAESGVTFVADHEEAGLFLAGELRDEIASSARD
jgi:hypothetical protein